MRPEDRRRNPRVAILGQLHGRIVTFDVPVTVLEISLGGMGIQTTVPFPLHAVHGFQLTLGDNSVVHLKGRVMHCNRLEGTEDKYVSGIQFIDESPDD